jgi:cadmium resistance protein CadD (predicted permease)
MHDLGAAITVAAFAFVATMIDNFAAFSAQLAITDRSRRGRASVGQFVGVVSLIFMSVVVAGALGEIPLKWVGLLAAAPLALAVHAWVTRHREPHLVKRGMVTTMVVTIALGGDNLAGWIPILRAGGINRGLVTVGVFVVLDLALIGVARLVASHPAVVRAGQRFAPMATPVLYVILAIVILWECGWF